MPIRVKVVGHGMVEFPDGTSEADMQTALASLSAPTVDVAEPPKRRDTPIGKMDIVVGELKGAGQTVTNLGKMIHKVPGFSEGIDMLYGSPGLSAASFAAADQRLEPTNKAQRIGKGIEQIAEFFIPAGGVGRLAKAAEVAKSGGLTLLQGGSPLSAGVSAGLTAVIPGASAAQRASSGLKSSAEKNMAQALGATKDVMKDEAAKLAPQMLKRGVGGSRAAMLELAEAKSAQIGSELEAAYTAAAQAGQTISSAAIQSTLGAASDAFRVANAAGKSVVIPGTEHIVQRLDDLGQFVSTLGPDIPIDKAVIVKRTWDDIASTAGLFGSKATASSIDNAAARATKAAADSFRNLLNGDVTIGALNKEASFWIGLKNVLNATQHRTQAQSGGLIAAALGGSGAVAGALTGNSVSDRAQNAVLGGLAGRQLVKVIQSPAFRTQVSGPLKNTLADALASGQQGKILHAISRITASLPSQVSAAAR